MRRGLLVAMLLCAAGAGLLLIATSQTWVALRFPAVEPLPERRIDTRGNVLVPGARALALVGLAAVPALPAIRGRGRQLVGLLLAAAGAGAVAVVVHALLDPAGVLSRVRALGPGYTGDTGFGGWPYVALLGGLLLCASGVLAVVRGRSWRSLGARYDAPTAPKQPSLWDSLDRGDDPTT